MKNILLIDEDVDRFDTDDVFWAMPTRTQGNIDIIATPVVSCHILDVQQTPEYESAFTQHDEEHAMTANFRMPAAFIGHGYIQSTA